MNATTLLSRLDAIWYLVDTEDENKQACVSRRNVLPLVEMHLEHGEPMENLLDLISDDNSSMEVAEYHYSANIDDAYQDAEALSRRPKELSLDDFVGAFKHDLKVAGYRTVLFGLCVALEANNTLPDAAEVIEAKAEKQSPIEWVIDNYRL